MERTGQFPPFEVERKNPIFQEKYTGIENPIEQGYIYGRAIQEATGSPASAEDIVRASTLIHGSLSNDDEFKVFTGDENLERFILKILGSMRYVELMADFPNGEATIYSHPKRDNF